MNEQTTDGGAVRLERLVGLPQKPARGARCNGCGMCCAVEPCRLAAELLNCTKGPCIALERDETRTYCGLVRRPAHYMFGQDVPESETGRFSVMLASMLGIGTECDADDVEPNDQAQPRPSPQGEDFGLERDVGQDGGGT